MSFIDIFIWGFICFLFLTIQILSRFGEITALNFRIQNLKLCFKNLKSFLKETLPSLHCEIAFGTYLVKRVSSFLSILEPQYVVPPAFKTISDPGT